MANISEIGEQMKRLTNTMTPPRGIKFETAFEGYVTALTPFSVEEISEAIDRYLSGEFADVSLKFFPRPPELGKLCRVVRTQHGEAGQRVLRAEQMAREQRESREAEIRAQKTPEQLAKGKDIYQKFLDDHAAYRQAIREAERGRRAQPPMSEEEYFGKVNERFDQRVGQATRAATEAERIATARAVRDRYGMTDEALGKIRDRPLPRGMRTFGDAVERAVGQQRYLPPPRED